jgi:hypothetical protein
MQNEKKTARENTQDDQSEHLRIGQSFSALMEKELADYTREHGDTEKNRRYATDVAYSRIEKEFGRSRSLARLYIRCYRTFSTRPDDFGKLTLREMMLRLRPTPPGTL